MHIFPRNFKKQLNISKNYRIFNLMKYACHFLLLAVLLACSGEGNKRKNKQHNQVPEPNILNLSFVYSEGEKIISFPVWFNDSIVKKRKIKSVERVFYYESADSSESGIEGNINITPEKKITYLFDKDGLLKEMQIGNYYDNRLISTIKAVYSEHQPETGYAKVQLNETLRAEDFPYHEFRQLKNTKNLVSFEEINSKNRLFSVPDKKHWKPLVIDTLCKPGKDDIIIWGSLKHPEKIYSVQNLVEESNVRSFTYENGVLKHIDWTDDPFKIHRTFRFDKEGLCTGFVDSTFSMGGFVASANFIFELKDRLPVSVTKELVSRTGKRVIFRETFEYVFE